LYDELRSQYHSYVLLAKNTRPESNHEYILDKPKLRAFYKITDLGTSKYQGQENQRDAEE
jgi:hypothetical protein